MRYLVTAAAAAMLSAGAAQAVVLDLTYTVEGQITSVRATNNSHHDFTFTRQVGDIETFVFDAFFDTERGYMVGNGTFGVIDESDGSGSMGYSNADESFSYELLPNGTGSLHATIASAPEIDPVFIWETVDYDIVSWSVEGLPEVAPVPLPASLPLLAVGLGAIGFTARRRSKRAAAA